ncbi:DUF3558 domain-containing protein [Nocardia sp. alder85J]|nr:DUF3558 domain-containing protein [Nocardia sp. alder85J]
MNRWKRGLGSVCLIGVAGLWSAGCGSNGNAPATGTSTSVSSTLLPPAPTAFDPCSDVLKPALDSEQLQNKQRDDSNGNGGTQWRGCQWVQPDGYSVSIRTTNITLPMVRANTGFKVAEELTIGGRSTITYHDSEATDLRSDCVLDVELTGGSLEFLLDNPASRRKTGSMDTCDIAKTLAGKVVP